MKDKKIRDNIESGCRKKNKGKKRRGGRNGYKKERFHTV